MFHTPPIIASIIFTIGILGLFYLDRGSSPRLSKVLWIPAVWLFLISSRPFSLWLGINLPSFSGADSTDVYVEGNPVERAVLTILILAAVVVLVTRMQRVGPILRKNALLLLYLLFCLISIFWSDFPFVAFKRWTKIIGDVAMVLIILTETHPLAALKRIVIRLSLLLFPLSVLFIKYYPHFGRRVTNSWTSEPVGVTLQKNSLGLICLMYGVLFLWMFWSAYRDREDSSRSRRLLAYGTIIAMIIWLLSQCRSMTSIAGLTLTAGVMWLAMRPWRRPAFVHVLVLTVLGLSLVVLFFGGSILAMLGKDTTLSGRTYTWSLLLSMHTNPLVGTGFESFWLGPRLDYMEKAWPNFHINEAHNGWVEVYINLGWVGLCFIAGLVLTAYTRVMYRFRSDPRTATLFLGFFLCTLFNSFSENAFRLMTPSWVFLVIVVVAGSQAELFRNVARPEPIPPRDIAADHEPAYARTETPSFAEQANRF